MHATQRLPGHDVRDRCGHERIGARHARAEVVQKVASPTRPQQTRGGETLRYRKMERALGWSPTSYFVRLEAGKVVEYGRRDD